MTEKYLEKQIWKLFKLNRDEVNKAERQIEAILLNVYGVGKKDGAKEENNRIKIAIKH